MKSSLFKLCLLSFVALFVGMSCSKHKSASPSQGNSDVLNRVVTKKALRVASEFKGPPFTLKQNGENVGFEVDLMNAIAKELGVTVEWKEVAFDVQNFSKMLSDGEVDLVVAAVTKTADRAALFDFSDDYFTSGQNVVVLSDATVPDHFELSLLKGKKVGVAKGTTGEDFARNNTAADIVVYGDAMTLMEALRKKEIEAFISDVPDFQPNKFNPGADMKVVLKRITRETYAFAAKKGEGALIGKLNAILSHLKEDAIDGDYAQIYRKWFLKE